LAGNKPDSEDPEGIYPTFVMQKSGRRVPVVQAYAYTKYLGQLNLEFNSLGEVTHAVGNPLLLDHNIEQGKSYLVVRYIDSFAALPTSSHHYIFYTLHCLKVPV
jgi:5'-nucleotidase